MQQTMSLQQDMLRRRLPVVITVLLVASLVLIIRLILFQAPQDPRVAAYVEALRESNYETRLRQYATRGIIYDRNMQPLAANSLRYRIGISPNLISEPEETIAQLSAILGRDPLEIRAIVNSDAPYEHLGTNIEPDIWRQIDELDMMSIDVETIPRRLYPQGDLTSQVIGFVAGDDDTYRGYNGVEGYYQTQLAGRMREATISRIPFEVPEDATNETALDRGANLVLTIDRDIQYLAHQELLSAIELTGAVSGTIIVMNPMNGDILAMTSYPSFDPNAVAEIVDPRALINPAISNVYEPGSVFKVLTMAAGLDHGTITPDWTYNDAGSLMVGGLKIENWDKAAYGVMTPEQILVESLNIGTATVAIEMGTDAFYSRIRAFGIGQPTRVDLEGEEGGILNTPGSESWGEADLASNSFGQGVSVTPLQMLNAVNAIANGGLLMQPRVVSEIIQGNTVYELDPIVVRRVISQQTAATVTNWMVSVVNEGLDERARLPGYTIAGKTGTAQIPNPIGYETNAYIMTFVGFFPADDPRLSVLVKLDRPTSGQFASQTAAPVFSRLAERLVIMMEIPTDEVRYALAAEGGVVGGIDR